MAKIRDNVRMYGDLDSEVFLAPLGTTLPTTLDDPSGSFEAIGWITEDGVPFSREVDTTKLKGWQGSSTLRVKITSDEKMFSFSAMEEKPLVTELYFGHSSPTVTGAGSSQVAKMDIPTAAGVVERAAVIKYVDGGVTKFICCENVQITPDGEVPHKTDEGTVYGFNAEVVGDSFMLTNAAAYLEGSSSS